MPVFNTQGFIESQLGRGRSTESIIDFLNKKGIDPSLPSQEITEQGQVSFRERLKASFGDKAGRERGQQLEKQAGLAGKFDIGDLADIAGAVPSFIGFLGGSIAGAVGGPGGSIAGGAAGAAAGDVLKQGIGKLAGVRESFSGKEVAAEGALGLAAGGLGLAAGKLLKPAAKIAGKQTKALTSNVLRTFFGPGGESAIKARFADPKGVKSFILTAQRKTGGATFEDVTKLVTDSVEKVTTSSKEAFALAETNIIQKQLPKKEIVESIRTTLKELLSIDKISKANIRSSVVEADEKKILKMLGLVDANKDWTTRGVLNLKRKVGKQINVKLAESQVFGAKLAGSRGIFNQAIGAVDKDFAKAMTQFATDDTLLRQIGATITGTSKFNIDQVGSKLLQIAKDLDDPFKKEASKKLLEELERRTGLPLIQTLRNLASAENLSPQGSQGFISGLVRELARLAKQGVSGVAGGAGRVAQKAQALPPVTQEIQSLIQRFGEAAVFESLSQLNER